MRSARPARDHNGAYRHLITTTGTELWQRIDAASARFVTVATAVDPNARVGTWTVHEVVAHVLSVLHRYTKRDFLRWDGLADDAAGVTWMNDREMRALVDRPLTDLIEALDDQVHEIKRLVPESTDLTTRVPFHGGLTVDAAAWLSNLIGELLVHGRDIARTDRQAFPIDQRDAVLVVNGLVQLPNGFMKPDARPVTVGFRIRGAVPWLFDMDAGCAVSRPMVPGERTDVVLRGPAATLMLAFYGRYSIVGAARRGLLVAGGRRPWRAARVVANIDNP